MCLGQASGVLGLVRFEQGRLGLEVELGHPAAGALQALLLLQRLLPGVVQLPQDGLLAGAGLLHEVEPVGEVLGVPGSHQQRQLCEALQPTALVGLASQLVAPILGPVDLVGVGLQSGHIRLHLLAGDGQFGVQAQLVGLRGGHPGVGGHEPLVGLGDRQLGGAQSQVGLLGVGREVAEVLPGLGQLAVDPGFAVIGVGPGEGRRCAGGGCSHGRQEGQGEPQGHAAAPTVRVVPGRLPLAHPHLRSLASIGGRVADVTHRTT
jgi:hypothetical protein